MKKKIPEISIALIMLITAFTANNLKWGRNHWRDIFGSDVKGYYSYLPAIFIYHDPHFSFYDSIEKKHFTPDNIFDYRKKIDGQWVNKYYCGTALCELPFFLTAHIFAVPLGFENDGYTKPYAIAISIAGMFYLFIGLLFLKKLMELYDIRKWGLALLLAATVLGTNLFYYVACDPGMSHVYSFAFVSIFLYSLKKIFLSHNSKLLLLTGISLGIIVLIRPVNILVLAFAPFIAGSFNALKNGFRHLTKNKIYTVTGIFLFLLIVSFQLIFYKFSTGHFLVYSYSNERFNFTDINIINFLFSYRKGMFLYAPLLFVAFISGLFYLWKQRKFEFSSFLFAFLITVYVLSSWWMWWYGGSFGCRVFIEYIPLMSVLLGISLTESKKKSVKIIIVSLVIILSLFMQFQIRQYRIGRINWADMNYELYWNSFSW